MVIHQVNLVEALASLRARRGSARRGGRRWWVRGPRFQSFQHAGDLVLQRRWGLRQRLLKILHRAAQVAQPLAGRRPIDMGLDVRRLKGQGAAVVFL